MNRAEVEKRCYLACEAEVIARGFPVRFAHDLIEASQLAHQGNWTEAEKRQWFDLMFVEYQCQTNKDKQALVEAFIACSELIVNYAKLVS